MGLFRVLMRTIFPKTRQHVVVEKVVILEHPARPRQEPQIRTWRDLDEARPDPVLAPPSPQQVTVKGHCFVIDGDTIVIGDARIRLAGIDAPELDQPYGKKAKWALVKLCKDQQVRAVLDGSMSYDRTVATCYLPDGRDLSAEMVKLGLAVDWTKFSGGRYRHLEPPETRKLLWRCDARQKGRMPPAMPD
jgi:endonuclease YncB( thermonuclease family)